MAKFFVEITTSAKAMPKTNLESVAERAKIQAILVQILSAVSSCGNFEGGATAEGATGRFHYVAGSPAAASDENVRSIVAVRSAA